MQFSVFRPFIDTASISVPECRDGEGTGLCE